MRKASVIVAIILILVGFYKFYSSKNRSLEIELFTTATTVSEGEPFLVDVKVIHKGKKHFVLKGNGQDFSGQWASNNANIRIWSASPGGEFVGSPPEIVLGPGDNYAGKMYTRIPYSPDDVKINESTVFKLGFKQDQKSSYTWSNSVKIQIKRGKMLPVKIEALTKIAKVKSSESIKVPVRITNTSSVPQHIGTETCDVHGVQGWYTDKDYLISDGWMCDQSSSPDRPIILKPGEAYEQICEVHFLYGKVQLGTRRFRLCFHPYYGQGSAWSKDIEVEMVK